MPHHRDPRLVTTRAVPAGHGRAVRVAVGQLLSVTDVRGGQVGDLFVFLDDGGPLLATHLSAAHTRGHTNRIFPAIGEDFVSTDRSPVLGLVEDTSPGAHDMLIPACDPARYRLLGASEHRSCEDNAHQSLDELDLSVAVVPQPVNLFMDVAVTPDGLLTWSPAPSRCGDRVTFIAHLDVVVVLSACPQDLVPVNTGPPTELRLDVLDRP